MLVYLEQSTLPLIKPWWRPDTSWMSREAAVRKLRLFSVACIRRHWHLVRDPCSQAVVNIVERSADGSVGQAELLSLELPRLNEESRGMDYDAAQLCRLFPDTDFGDGFELDDLEIARWTSRGVSGSVAEATRGPRGEANASEFDRAEASELAAQCQLFRDIFGNPFRPATPDPRWLSASVLDLARAIYDERAFERLPIIADALMDAGCGENDLLNHCRSEGPHVRGRWVVDLLLGAE